MAWPMQTAEKSLHIVHFVRQSNKWMWLQWGPPAEHRPDQVPTAALTTSTVPACFSSLFTSLSLSHSLALCHCLAIMQRVLIMTTAAREEAQRLRQRQRQRQKATSNENERECNPAVFTVNLAAVCCFVARRCCCCCQQRINIKCAERN